MQLKLFNEKVKGIRTEGQLQFSALKTNQTAESESVRHIWYILKEQP